MAAAATPPGVVDPTKLGKYPVILSDALRGESPKEILTAIRYNHKPTLSSDAAPSAARLKPSSTSSTSTYDLGFTDDGGKYAYSGTRSTKENQYALVFDPERKAFILHRIDSTFTMNLTRTPSNADAEALREEHPHLDSSSIRVSTDANSTGGAKKGPGAGKGTGLKKGGRNAAKNAGMVESKRSAPTTSSSSMTANKSKAAGSSATTVASASQKDDTGSSNKKTESKPRAPRSPLGSEEEDDSDDDLLIEYPDPQPSTTSSFARIPSHNQDAGPAPIRRFSEFMASAGDDESDEDADAEYDEDDLLVEDEAGDSSAGDGFKLPSPVGNRNAQAQQQEDYHAGGGGDDAPGEDDLPEDDELMAMLEEEIEGGGGGGGMDVDSESSVSEED